MIGIDLFAGAGGMTLGARAAGVRVIHAVELNRNAANTYAKNHPGVNCFVGDIRDFRCELDASRNEPLVVFGGPPCQGFSTSNQRTRSSDNPANWLFREFLSVVGALEPDCIVLENVAGMLQTEHGKFLSAVLTGLARLGYAHSHALLNAAEYGVPQNRSRLFIVGSRVEKTPSLPTAMRGKPNTVRDAIGDLPHLQNGASRSWRKYRKESHSDYSAALRQRLDGSENHLVTTNAPHIIERFSYVPQGGNWEDIPPRLMRTYRDRNACHTGIYHRLKMNEPAKVIGNFRKNMLIHPTQNRGLSVREAARLQSFPDTFEFSGSIGVQQQQVGNAVPPLLAEAVFRTLLRQT
jgi:DNA (cytosine-5)-methyltransferase 1